MHRLLPRAAIVPVAMRSPLARPGAAAQAQFDVPLAAAFAELEAVPVDLALPLLGYLTAMAAHDDARLVGQPGLQVGLGGLLIGLELVALRYRRNSSMWSRNPWKVSADRHCRSPGALVSSGISPSLSAAGRVGRGRL